MVGGKLNPPGWRLRSGLSAADIQVHPRELRGCRGANIKNI